VIAGPAQRLAGADLGHVLAFRTWRDVDAIAAAAASARRAVVVGGGLLGLEAAAGLHARGVAASVVELADRLMPQQLDAGASAALARALARLGIEARVGTGVEAIEPQHVRLVGGEALAADLVVVAAGVRAETALARAAGLEVRRGIVVDDALRTSVPGVWAVGECAEHRGVVPGLWAPCAEQARAAAAGVVGDPAAFLGSTPATTLKVAGVDLFAGGVAEAHGEMDELTVTDTRRGTYRRLVLDGERLAGAVLVGDVAPARALSELLRTERAVPEALLEPGAAVEAPPPSDADVICSCNGVTRGALRAAIRAGGLTDVAQVANATRATTGCGSCAPDVARLCSSTRNTDETDGQRDADTMAA